MAEHSAIEWTDSTFNPWEGCQKVGPGCDHCYAEHRNARFGGGQAPNWGPGAPRRRTGAANWRKPLQWEREHAEFFAQHGRRRRVFCASLADVFDNEVSPAWRADLFELIDSTPHLDWLLLTKRISNVQPMLDQVSRDLALRGTGAPWPPRPNVWLGATVVNQAEADRDIPKLLAVPARVRFLSVEPMLEPIALPPVRCDHGSVPGPGGAGGISCPDCGGHGDRGASGCQRLHWIICGGESGPKARPMHPDWARSLRDQCAAAGVPFLFKQWGEWICAGELRRLPGGGMPGFGIYDACQHDMATDTVRVGKKAAGRLLDGVEHNGFPEAAQ